MTTLAFDVLWRDRGATRGMRELGNQTEIAARRHEQFKKVAIAGGILAAAAIVKFGKDSVAAYKEAATAQARLSDAFGRFPRLADTNINALRGLNTELAKKTRFDDDATASGQAVLAQFKLTGQQITQLTPLLQDYAAKTGKDLPTAARDLGKAVMGQGRALKAVGLNLKDTGSATGNLNQLMSGLRTQVGGFAEREGKTAAGQAEILKNQFGELQEQAGAVLVPALNRVVHSLIDLVGFVQKNSKVIGPLVAVTAGLAGAIWLAQKASAAWAVTQSLTGALATKAVGGLSALKLAFTGVAISATTAGRAVKIAQLSIPVLGVALFAVTSAMQFFAAKSDDASMQANSFADAMQSVEGKVTQATAALNEQVRAQAVSLLQSKGAFDQAKLLGLSYSTVTDAALGNKAAIAEVNRVLTVALALNPQLSKSNSDLRNAAVGLSGSLNGVAHESISAAEAERTRRAAMLQGVPATDSLADAQKRLRDKSRDVRVELQGILNKLTILKQGALDQETANLAWGDALKAVARSAKENGRALSDNTQKGRDNRRSIIGAMIALNDKATADFRAAAKSRDSAKAAKEASARYQDNRRDLIKAAIAAGFSKEEVRKMIAQYTKTPKALKTEVTTPGSKKSREELKDLKAKVDDLKSKKITMTFATNAAAMAAKYHVSLSGQGTGGGRARGGILSGFTPLSRGDDVAFPMAGGGIQPLRGGEGIAVSEVMRDPHERALLLAKNKAALRGESMTQFRGLADGGVVNRHVTAAVNGGQIGQLGQIMPVLVRFPGDLGRQVGKEIGDAVQSRIRKAAAAAAGGPIGGKGYASALSYARRHAGHPYVYASLWDCSGFMSALHSIILGQRPHRRYTTTAFHGAHAAGFTRGKSSPFRVGVRPLSGKFGHMAGTLNGVNVESSGGVGVRVGGRARGANSGMFSWRGGLAKGGVIGDLPFDLLDPQGERYQPWLADLVHKAGYHRGGRIGAGGPERVLSAPQNRAFEHLVRVMDRRGSGAGNVYHVTINAPNYLGSRSEFKNSLVQMARSGDLDVVLARAGAR